MTRTSDNSGNSSRLDSIILSALEGNIDKRISEFKQGQQEAIAIIKQAFTILDIMERRLERMEENQASLIAGQERHARILDSILRRIDGQDADS